MGERARPWIVELRDVSLRIDGTQVLEGISLEVPSNDFLALIGPNGAGKSTLIRIMLGITPLQSGSVRLFGEDVRSFRGWHKVSYIPQHAAAFDGRFPASVAEIVSLGRVPRRGLFHFLTDEDRTAIRRALEVVGLRDTGRARAGTLSGGQRQRVLIARALASEPELLVLDEPTSGVDPGTQAQFYELLRQLNEERGLTILLATHDLGAVLHIAKTVACINRRIVCHTPAAQGLTADLLLETYGSPLAAMTHAH